MWRMFLFKYPCLSKGSHGVNTSLSSFCRSRECLGCMNAGLSFCCFFLIFCLSDWLPLILSIFSPPPSVVPLLTHPLPILLSLIILPLFPFFYWSHSLPNSLSPLQIPSHMLYQCNPLPWYLIIKAAWQKKRFNSLPATIESIPLHTVNCNSRRVTGSELE